jgi:outer membrane protein OmpA-like peptidoglycan-associated protein
MAEEADTGSLSRLLAGILLVSLVGVLILYDWYSDTLKRALSEKEAQRIAVEQRVEEANQEIRRLGKTEAGLLAQIEQREAQHQGEIDRLTDERQKSAEALAESVARYEAARQEIAALEAERAKFQVEMEQTVAQHDKEVAELNQAMTTAAREHESALAAREQALQAETERLQQVMSARIELFKIALEGDSPELAAQLAALEGDVEQAKSRQLAAEEKVIALEAEKAALEETIASKDQSLADGAALLSKTQEEAKAELRRAEKERLAAKASADEQIQSLNQDLARERSALSALQQELQKVTDDLNARLLVAAESLEETRGELAATIEAANSKESSLQQRIDAANSTISDLERQVVLERQMAAKELASSEEAGRKAVEQLRGLYEGFGRLGATRTDRGMLLNLGGKELNFRIGQAEFRSDELPSLDQLAQFLNTHPELSARIEGHTDSLGQEATNLKLSQARADTVLAALVERGVTAEQLSSEGMGEANPIATNDTKYGRYKNRRVDIYITGY